MSSSDVKIEKSKLLQKYAYTKTTSYIIEKTKLNKRKLLLTAILFILQTRVEI